MKRPALILIGLAMFALASKRAFRQGKLEWFRQLSGSQKIFGIVAFALTLIILLNPEFLALGFLGDTAFFDMLVLALSFQLHMHVTRAIRWFVNGLTRATRWTGIPSPGLRFLIAISTVLIGDAICAVQKVAHRIWS